jgi:hypothetical protein
MNKERSHGRPWLDVAARRQHGNQEKSPTEPAGDRDRVGRDRRHGGKPGETHQRQCADEIQAGEARKERRRDLGQIGDGRIAFRAPVELEHGRTLVIPRRRNVEIFGPHPAIIEVFSFAELEQRPLEHGIALMQASRHEEALAALLVGGHRNDFADRDPVGAQEMRGLVRTLQRRGERDRQRSKQHRQKHESRHRARKHDPGGPQKPPRLDGGLRNRCGGKIVEGGHSSADIAEAARGPNKAPMCLSR